MSPLPDDDARTEAAVWQAMTLFSTFTTAVQVRHAASERRAGRDPSAQEAKPFVRAYLHRAAGALQAYLMQLQANLVQAERAEAEGHIAGLVRRYNHLMLLHGIAEHLKVVHQRLLSLYPEVPVALIEEARVMQQIGSTLLEAEDDAFAAQVQSFVRQGLLFAGRLHRAV
jgi:hypothetical protein